jgi:hypothetical protein
MSQDLYGLGPVGIVRFADFKMSQPLSVSPNEGEDVVVRFAFEQY